MNLLLVSPKMQESKGGIAVWTDMFLENCSAHGLKTDLLNIAMIGSRAQQSNGKRNFADEFVRTRDIFSNLKKILAAKEYDVAHVNTSCGTFGLIRDYFTLRKIKKSQPKCKTVIHFHCDVQSQAGSGYKKYFLKKLLRLSDEAMALNSGNRDFLNKAFLADAVAVPNFIQEQWLRKDKKVINEKIEKALFVGHIQPQKGAKEIFDLAKRFPNITFELIGEVRADVKEWEKPKNLVFCGTKDRPQIISALDSADVFIFPTHSEGFSLALLESMSRGLPSITTNVGANAEMLENRGGIVTKVGDVDAMAQAFEKMQDFQTRKEMSDWNIQKVKDFYTVNAAMAQIIEVYNR